MHLPVTKLFLDQRAFYCCTTVVIIKVYSSTEYATLQISLCCSVLGVYVIISIRFTTFFLLFPFFSAGYIFFPKKQLIFKLYVISIFRLYQIKIKNQINKTLSLSFDQCSKTVDNQLWTKCFLFWFGRCLELSVKQKEELLVCLRSSQLFLNSTVQQNTCWQIQEVGFCV